MAETQNDKKPRTFANILVISLVTLGAIMVLVVIVNKLVALT